MVDVLLDLELGRDPTHERDSVFHDGVWKSQVQELNLLTLLNTSMFMLNLVLLQIPVIKQGTTHMNRCPLIIDVSSVAVLIEYFSQFEK